MRIGRVSWLVGLLLPLLVSACKSWQPAAESPQTLITRHDPSFLRVTMRTTERHTLQNPTATRDSIYGDGEFGGRVGFHLDNVTLVEEKRFSALRTAVVAGVTFVGYTLFRQFFDQPRVE